MVGCLSASATEDVNKWDHLISTQKYSSLKTELYSAQPDVLSRETGKSIFDMAIAHRDKRASIIIAEYHNFTIKDEELYSIYSRINQLRDELTMEDDTNTQRYLNETLSLIEELDSRLKMIEEHNEFLEGKVSSLSSSNEKMAEFINQSLISSSTELSSVTSMAENNDQIINFLLDKMKSVEGQILSEEEALQYIQEGFNFVHEPALVIEK